MHADSEGLCALATKFLEMPCSDSISHRFFRSLALCPPVHSNRTVSPPDVEAEYRDAVREGRRGDLGVPSASHNLDGGGGVVFGSLAGYFLFGGARAALNTRSVAVHGSSEGVCVVSSFVVMASYRSLGGRARVGGRRDSNGATGGGGGLLDSGVNERCLSPPRFICWRVGPKPSH